MAASSEVVQSPATGYFAWERPDGLVRFTEFALTLAPPWRQLEIHHENPLCRLAARTAAGSRVCGQGCGMCAAGAASHVCPFGMLMVQAPPAPGAAAARWIGRRFPGVDAMHEGLDRLSAEGIDEETILAHLAPNPIASAEEMRQAALGARTSSSAPNAECGMRNAELGSRPIQTAPTGEATQICNLLEYLEQVHRLIAGAARPEAVCERFLRAVAAVVPFDEMAIYLNGMARASAPVVPSDWVIATVVESGRIQGQPQAQPCRLEPGGLGAAALAQHQILMKRGHTVEPFAGRLEGPATLAIPFPLTGGGEPVGVWLAMQGETPRACALGGEVVRYMRLLSEFLGARVQQLEEMAEARVEAGAPMSLPVEAACGHDPAVGLADALCAAGARAARHNEPFALLCLSARGRGPLPAEDLTREFGAILRPYDTLIGENAESSNAECGMRNAELNTNTWFAVLPYAHEAAARLVAARLMTVFEDVLDAHGGAEEQGARLDIGGSVWGADAAGAEQMILNASAAAAAAAAEPEPGVRFFDAEPAGNGSRKI